MRKIESDVFSHTSARLGLIEKWQQKSARRLKMVITEVVYIYQSTIVFSKAK